jgi:hypothetical protein
MSSADVGGRSRECAQRLRPRTAGLGRPRPAAGPGPGSCARHSSRPKYRHTRAAAGSVSVRSPRRKRESCPSLTPARPVGGTDGRRRDKGPPRSAGCPLAPRPATTGQTDRPERASPGDHRAGTGHGMPYADVRRQRLRRPRADRSGRRPRSVRPPRVGRERVGAPPPCDSGGTPPAAPQRPEGSPPASRCRPLSPARPGLSKRNRVVLTGYSVPRRTTAYSCVIVRRFVRTCGPRGHGLRCRIIWGSAARVSGPAVASGP